MEQTLLAIAILAGLAVFGVAFISRRNRRADSGASTPDRDIDTGRR